MRKTCYLVVNEAFKAAFEGTRHGANVLATATTSDGRIVISLNAVNEFPAVFEGIGQDAFSIVWLTADDFPKPPALAIP